MKNVYTHSTSTETKFKIGNRAQDLVAFGRSQGWDFPVLGHAPYPSTPVHINDWLIVPAHLDSTPLPARAQDRMDAIFAAGIRPKGWLLVHEAPKYLPANVEEREVPTPTTLLSPRTRQQVKTALKTVGTVMGTLAVATGTAALAIAAVVAFLPVALISGAILIDPILVAVTEDGFWVEIDRWDVG